MDQKRPKWDLSEAISKGKESIRLLDAYEADLQPRLKPDEAAQHKLNVEALQESRSGQPEALVAQKSKTRGQNSAIGELRQEIVGIRDIVKSVNAPAGISKSYGVGERLSSTVSAISASANLILNAYKSHTAWSNDAGIIEADMEQIQTLKDEVLAADNVQEESKFTRKSKTMDKNTLQRTVEDEVSKISALGALIFRRKDPSVAAVFESLIPGSGEG